MGPKRPVLGPLPGPVWLPGTGGSRPAAPPFPVSVFPLGCARCAPRCTLQAGTLRFRGYCPKSGTVPGPSPSLPSPPQCRGPAAAITRCLPAPRHLSRPEVLWGCLLPGTDVWGLFGGDSGKIKSSKRSWVSCSSLPPGELGSVPRRGELGRGRIVLCEVSPQLSLPSPNHDF